ncbi:MAG: hypothetical protein WCA10_17515 [Terracidiphilus sp.]
MHLRRIAASLFAMSLFTAAPLAQQPEASAIIHDLDVANQARFDNVLSFTDVEHYSVFRGNNQISPAAEMTVKMSYKKGVGKDYVILKQSGSSLIQKFGLHPLLENEKAINNPATVAQSWFTSANYEMRLKPGVNRPIGGRQCLAIAITPRRKAPNMIDGTLWVDAGAHTLVEVEGIASKSPSVFAGTTKMMRRYTIMRGYAMATHARAESSSLLFGRTVITIDYSDYHFQLRLTQ